MKPPALKRLSVEQFSKLDSESRKAIESLAGVLNPFIGTTTAALTKNLTIDDNLSMWTREVTVETTAAPPAGAVAASDISVTPSGSLSSVNVQAALEELLGDIVAATTAVGVSNTPAGNLTATNVQAALNELQADIDDTLESQWQNGSGGKIFYDLGFVGIGAGEPTVSLDVGGDAKIAGNLTVNTHTFHADSTNNTVGMGTNTPDTTSKLHIVAEGSDLPLFVDRYTSVAALPSGVLVRTARGTPDAPAAVQNNDFIGAFAVRAYGASAFSATANAGIAFKATQDWTDSAQGTSAFIATTPNGSTGFIPRLHIQNDGNVGIGTTTPTNAKLHVVNDSAVVQAIHADTYLNGGTTGSGIVFRTARGSLASPSALQAGDMISSVATRGYGATGFSTTSRAAIRTIASENWTDTAQGTEVRIATTPTGSTTNTERLTFDGNGNILINASGGRIHFGSSTAAPSLFSGTGDPNGVHTAAQGSMFLRTDGLANTTLYIKTGGTSNTDWNPLN